MLEAEDTLSDSLNSKHSDIESQKIPIINSDYKKLNKTKQQVEHLVGILKNSKENERQSEEAIQFCANICVSLLTLLINTPLVIADLYFAFTDHSCLNNSTIPVINLFIYLLVSGIYTGIDVLVNFVILYFNIYKTFDIRKSCVYINLFTTIFGLIWTLIGVTMFWKSFEYYNSCHNGIYNYVFAQLIIKLVLTVINFKRICDKR